MYDLKGLISCRKFKGPEFCAQRDILREAKGAYFTHSRSKLFQYQGCS